MKPNNLLEGINTDINIEKGLKMLQFGTQFYLHRTYLRNCPLVRDEDDEETNIKKQQEDANIIAQLNEYLTNPSASQSRLKLQKQAIQLIAKTNHQVQMLKSKEKSTSNPPPTEVVEVKKSVKETVKPMNDKSNKKISNSTSIDSPQSAKKKDQIKANLAKKISKISSPFQKQKNDTMQQLSYSSSASNFTSNISPQSLSKSDISISNKGSKDDSRQQLKESDFASYYSDTKPMATIQQANQSLQNGSCQVRRFNKDKPKPQYYNLSDFLSIRDEYSIGNSTFLPRQVKVHKQPQVGKINKSIQAELKPQSNSFLNKSISRVKESNEKSFISDVKANQTELNLLREISDSFAEEEKLKHLMKLQNFQLEEKFLLQRMQKRFQGCAKNIASIRSISWTSLKMPQTQIIFKRPDYAHCLEPLQ